MNPSTFSLEAFLHSEKLGHVIAATILLLLGWFLARTLAGIFERSMQHRLTAHQLLVWRRIIYHGVLIIFLMSALREMGFQLSVLLGAAGILSVAIGFASQTSASNFISGLFLIGEGSIAIGDTIRVGQTEGDVMSIDLLSVKLRTGDNLYVRIPNEQLIKSEVTNFTRLPIRRISINLGVAYEENLAHVRETLLKVAAANPLCLDEPAPQVIMLGFGDSAINLQLQAWVRRENNARVRDQLQDAIKQAFDENGIEIPYPHQVAVSKKTPPVTPAATAPAAPEAATLTEEEESDVREKLLK